MNSRAQAWYMDFAIALLLFIFTVATYFSYTNNFQKEDQGDLNSMLADSKSLSSSLALSGFPENWDNKTIVRIGISDDQRLNTAKLRSFKQLNYSQTKKKFGTVYDYFAFFTSSKGDILNINGICGVGHPLVNLTYNIKSAYYYQDPADSFLRDFMSQTFVADIYFNDIDALAGNLNNYQLLVMEHPLLSASKYNAYKDDFENFVSNGGYMIISDELTISQGKDLVGATFYKQSQTGQTAIVNNTDPYLSLQVGQSMAFAQYNYVRNNTASVPPAAGFTTIAAFNQTNDNAIARWNYGNGAVYFFSDFDVSNFNGNFVKMVEETAESFIQGTCTPINLTIMPRQRLVKTERYLNYNSQVIKMVVYMWQ